MTVYETSYLDPPWILSFDHAELLSWWQFKRFFNRAGASVVCKPFADIVVVHPAPRFTTAATAVGGGMSVGVAGILQPWFYIDGHICR